MKRTIFLGIIIIVLSLALTLLVMHRMHPIPHPMTHRVAREQFLNAQTALANNDRERFLSLAQKLKDYPLYPYLIASDLTARIDSLPQTEIDNFFQQYSDSYAAVQLRNNWLLALARVGRWDDFIKYYQPNKTTQMQCLYGQALYHTNQFTDAYDLGKQLWLAPYSQPSDCDALFAFMAHDGVITPDLVWQRFLLTIKKGNYTFALLLKAQLPFYEQAIAKKWLIVKQNPRRINDTNLFPKEDNKDNEILTFGLRKLADINPNDAAITWSHLQKDHHFTSDQTQQIIQAIAIGFIRTNHEKAIPWLHQINPDYLNELAMNWRLRFALQENNWRDLLSWIESLPSAEQTQVQWQYWRARSLEQLGQIPAANSIYQQLATQRGYYGFLSADRLGIAYPLNNDQPSISKEAYREILDNPNMKRAIELFALKRKNQASKEWLLMLANLNEEQRYVAARLAYKLHWTEIALKSTNYIDHPNDLVIRYPTFYYASVKKQSESYNLGMDFIYAIIRQESLFRPDANSYAGAMGLMQLMPSTAKMLVNEDNLPLDYSDHLNTPKINIKLGSQYLNRLMTITGQSVMLSAAAYNAGPSKVRSWLPQGNTMPADIWVEMIPYQQTNTYVKNVLSNAVVYQYLTGQQPNIKVLMPDVQPK